MSQAISSLVHRLALFIRPLRAGILNPYAFNLWFLTQSEDALRGGDTSDSKLQALKRLKQDFCAISAQTQPSSPSNGIYGWDAHPLVNVNFRRFAFMRVTFIVVSSITSENFDRAFYVSKNPEVSIHNENPLSHYVVYGFFGLLQPSDGVFNSRPESDWNMRDRSHRDKRDYLWASASERALLIPTNFTALEIEAASLIGIADKEISTPAQASGVIGKKNSVLVSVIIPCFEQARFLKECLQSVAEATSEYHECIIVDDGNSKEEDLAVLRSISAAAPHQRVFVLSQPNTGIAGARNAGLSQAQGKYVKFLDADDLITPGSIDVQINEMNEQGTQADVGGYRVVSDAMEVLAESIGPIGELPVTSEGSLDIPELIERWEQGVALPIHSLLVQRDQLQATETALRSKEDFRMWLELGAQQTTFSTSYGVVALYRQHDKQMTSGSRARHGLYFLEALFNFELSHKGNVEPSVLQSKIDYINDYYGSAPSRAWRQHSPTRDEWLKALRR